MVGEPLGLLANAIGREALDGLDNPRVESPPALLEKAASRESPRSSRP